MKTALVTGANKGIGFEVSRQLAMKDIHVFMGSRDEQRGTSAAATLQSKGLKVDFVLMDMLVPEHFSAARDIIERSEGKLDILINNAGIQKESDDWNVDTVTTIPMNVLRQTFDVNFFGMVELTQILLPLIHKSSQGRIVNVTSILASLQYHSTPGSNTYDTKTFAYNTSKTAVNAFTIHLAHALRNTSIKVNAAHPGWVKTDMGGAGAKLTLEEGAHTPVMLALLDENGPTGKYLSHHKEIPW